MNTVNEEEGTVNESKLTNKGGQGSRRADGIATEQGDDTQRKIELSKSPAPTSGIASGENMSASICKTEEDMKLGQLDQEEGSIQQMKKGSRVNSRTRLLQKESNTIQDAAEVSNQFQNVATSALAQDPAALVNIGEELRKQKA